MKILFLSDDFPPQSFGGAGISTYDLALGVQKAGHEVFVITTCRNKEESGKIDYNGLTVYSVVSDYPAKWRAYRSLYNPPALVQIDKILRDIKPDIVHANNVHHHLSYHSIKLSKRHAKTVVVTLRDAMSFSFGKLATEKYLRDFDARLSWLDQLRQARKRWNPLRNFVIRRYLACAHKRLAVSGALKKALEQNGIRDVGVLHSGADVDTWKVNQEEKVRFRNKHKLEGKNVVLFGGRLSGAKGGGKVLEAMVEIIKEVPDAVLLVAGKIDEYANAMKDEARKCGCDEPLIFTDWINREDVKLVYAVSDVVLVPSMCFDAFPRIVLEAMASGKPVVGTCYGGAPEIIVDGVTGHVVNPHKVEEISLKIVDLLKNPERMKKFGDAGRERVEREFNLKNQVASLISAYQNGQS
ncbi:MAG: hypothetical protein COV10_02080 [Candidatus Vogelbacteria bacterium CG10_big_fil_rev_8_21_14_0_10_51_16]|uniref:Glycosyltransferase family 1 protein n=1 Tax=Candidatus Vogelbacteria bacterium CG10_big_fil_rev_8_21_14_0_10_51_16 TaxID=1975045 RepID=A0A2H0REP7_9BACT|nr:MAG: hypothetical protein COV10_02080 [Candidatus Vogelbacteria bacterium CG10_big_fil_rev_8_21_14_0_10_51_16]